VNRLKNFSLLVLLLTVLLVGCNSKSSTVSEMEKQDFEAVHIYKNEKLNGTLKLPSKYENEELQITADLFKSEEKEKIEDIKLENNGNVYNFSSDLPSEGRWNIQYTIMYNDQTIVKNFTDIFGEEKIDLEEIEYLKITTDPETLTPNKDFNFRVSLLNEDGGLIKNSEVILQIEKEDIEYIDSLKMKENEKGVYEVKTKLPEEGKYEITVHINYIKGHKMESMELIVGTIEENNEV